MTSRTLVAVVLATLLPLLASAEELRPDGRYTGGSHVEASSAGVSFVVPPDWIGKFGRSTSSDVLVMGSDAIEGVGLAIMMNGQSTDQLAARLGETQDLGANVRLRPSAMPSIEGSRISVRYENEIYVGRAVALVGPAGKSIVFFFAGPQRNEALYARLVADLAASASFMLPRAASDRPSALAPQAATGNWSGLLSGQMLHYFSSYNSGGGSGGMSAHRVLHLCSDGRFAYSGDSSVVMNVPGATGSSGGRSRLTGRWHVEEPTETAAILILTGDDGRELRWRVQYDGKRTLVNGQRWLRAASDACR